MKKTLVIATLLLIGVAAWLSYELISPASALNQASAIECTLAWGRLAPFPGSARQLAISTRGGTFNREFRVSFVAPPADIEQWLRQSPGIREALPTMPSPDTRHFEIAPGDGAQHAEVTVDDTANRISIYVYWS